MNIITIIMIALLTVSTFVKCKSKNSVTGDKLNAEQSSDDNKISPQERITILGLKTSGQNNVKTVDLMLDELARILKSDRKKLKVLRKSSESPDESAFATVEIPLGTGGLACDEILIRVQSNPQASAIKHCFISTISKKDLSDKPTVQIVAITASTRPVMERLSELANIVKAVPEVNIKRISTSAPAMLVESRLTANALQRILSKRIDVPIVVYEAAADMAN